MILQMEEESYTNETMPNISASITYSEFVSSISYISVLNFSSSKNL